MVVLAVISTIFVIKDVIFLSIDICKHLHSIANGEQASVRQLRSAYFKNLELELKLVGSWIKKVSSFASNCLYMRMELTSKRTFRQHYRSLMSLQCETESNPRFPRSLMYMNCNITLTVPNIDASDHSHQCGGGFSHILENWR